MTRRAMGATPAAPRGAVLTHMHIDLDYARLRSGLPEHVEPAYVGMVLELDATE